MVNNQTVELVKKFEGLRLTSYKCPVGRWTIGYGSTNIKGRPVLPYSKINKDEAESLLVNDLDALFDTIKESCDEINLKLNDNQLGALVSFSYNLGLGPILIGGRSMNDALWSKDLDKIATTFLLYSKYTKKVLGFIPVKKTAMGLLKRRQAERDLFLA